MAAVESEDYLSDLRHNIRDTLQVVRIQFDIMVEAVEKCKDIEVEANYIGCIDAANTASREIEAFQAVTKKLAQRIEELDRYIKSRSK